MTRRSIVLPAIGFLTVSLFISVSLLAQHGQERRDRQDRHERMTQRGYHMGETPPDSGIFKADDLRWRRGPESLPRGAEYVLLEGDPSRPAPFTMRIKVPDGYRIPPHWHPTTERITIIEGTFHLGMGETFSEGDALEMPQGTYAFMPPGMKHFAYAKGETIVQLNGIGPWDIHYVNEEDDPRVRPTRPGREERERPTPPRDRPSPRDRD